MSNSDYARPSRWVKTLAYAVLWYIIAMMVTAFAVVLFWPARQDGVVDLLELVLSAKVIIALLAVGAGVRYDEKIQRLLDHLGGGKAGKSG